MNLPYSKTMTPSIKPKVHKNGATVKLVVVSDIQLDFFCEIEDASQLFQTSYLGIEEVIWRNYETS